MNNQMGKTESASEVLRKYAQMITSMPDHVSIAKGAVHPPVLTQLLEEQLNKLAKRNALFLPNLQEHNDSVAVFSDYGGEAKSSGYYVFTFLICSLNALHPFREAQSRLRVEYKLNDPVKELSFKSLGYGPSSRAIPGFLRNLNNLVPGIMVSVVVQKGLSVWGKDRRTALREIVNTLKELGYGEWKPEVAEKLASVVHLVSYFVSLLAKSGQKIFWQSDADAIMANAEKLDQTGKLFARVLRQYTDKHFSVVGYAKTFGKEDTMLLDLLSASDLVAGSIEHYLTRKDNMTNVTVKEEADQILVWHGYQGIALKKYAFVFRPAENGGVVSGTLDFIATIPPQNINFVDIPVVSVNHKSLSS